jgi:hypothetical protein
VIPEIDLILDCARAKLAPPGSVPTESRLTRKVDWGLTIRLAASHGMVPLLYSGLTNGSTGLLPESAVGALGARYEALAERSRRLAAELVRLLPLFEAQGIPAISFKGPELGVLAYGDLTLRPYGDLDLLLATQDVVRAEAVLYKEGYRAAGSWEWSFFFANDAGLGVDLHSQIGPPWDPVPAEFDEWFASRQGVSLDGGMVQTLAVEHLLLVLAIQFVRDGRSRTQRLIQLCDVAGLVWTHPALDWGFVIDRARAIGGLRALLLHLLLVRDLLATPLPQAIEHCIARDRTLPRLARTVRSKLVTDSRERGSRPPSNGPWTKDSLFYLRARERPRDKVGYLRVLLPTLARLAITPTERDRAFVRVPDSLGFLYYGLRPLRILLGLIRSGGPKQSTVPASRETGPG